MKQVQLIHNPGAGDEEHGREHLQDLLEAHGYKVNYQSSKDKDWKPDPEADILLVAGGDGTVRKSVAKVLSGKLLDRPGLIALLPLGTANNVAKALKLGEDLDGIVEGWKSGQVKSFDLGRVSGAGEASFFLESFGYGLFPALMKEMKKQDEDRFGSADEKLRATLEVLRGIVVDYKPRHCRLEVDGQDHSGDFLLAEVMNTPSIGPNLFLSPQSDPGDGVFEVVLVPADQRQQFLDGIQAKIDGREEGFSFPLLKAREVRISWQGKDVHIDDQSLDLAKETEVHIQLKKGLLDFLVRG